MTPLGRLGELSAWAISALAWALSFAAQVRLATVHGFGGWWSWEAFTFPLTTDLAGLVGMFLALDQARSGQLARVPWLIAGAAAGVMIAANIGSLRGRSGGDAPARMAALSSAGQLVRAGPRAPRTRSPSGRWACRPCGLRATVGAGAFAHVPRKR